MWISNSTVRRAESSPQFSLRRTGKAEHGFALLMALIFLLLISMLAITASQRALMQERMAGSLRNAQQARMGAETALRGVEYKLWAMAGQPGARLRCTENVISPDDGCVVYRSYSAPYATKGDVAKFQSASGWVPDIGVAYMGPARRGYTDHSDQPTAKLAKDPRYIIEDMGVVRPPGAGGLHESGNTGPNNGGQGQMNIHTYRITTRAAGGNANTVSIVQSTFDAPAMH